MLQTIDVEVSEQHNKRLVLDGDHLVFQTANDIVSLNLSFNKQKVLLSTTDVILDFDCKNSSVLWYHKKYVLELICKGYWR